MGAEPAQLRTECRPKCLVCGALGTPLHAAAIDPFMDTPGSWDVSRCPNPTCGSAWLNPSPVAEDLHLAYSQYFTHGDDERRTVGTPVRRFLYSAYILLTSMPAALTGLRCAKAKLECMFLDDVKPGRLLDVGCGDGKFLHHMKGKGWSVEGVDFDQKAVVAAARLYGLQIRRGDLSSARFPEDSFDAVTMSHVIEHVTHPLELLREACRVLRRGGQLRVTTPNPSSLGHQIFGKYWFGLDAPRHINLFTIRALEQLAKKAGFSNVRALTSAGRADTFLGASISIQEAPNHRSEYFPPPSPLRTLRAARLQYTEHFRLRADSEAGEEAVLLCEK